MLMSLLLPYPPPLSVSNVIFLASVVPTPFDGYTPPSKVQELPLLTLSSSPNFFFAASRSAFRCCRRRPKYEFSPMMNTKVMTRASKTTGITIASTMAQVPVQWLLRFDWRGDCGRASAVSPRRVRKGSGDGIWRIEGVWFESDADGRFDMGDCCGIE